MSSHPHVIGRRARAVAAVFVLALAIIGLQLPTAAAAVDDPPAEVTITVTAGVRGMATPASAVPSTVTVSNTTSRHFESGQVVILLNPTPLPSSQSVDRWLTLGRADGQFHPVGTAETPATGPASSQSVNIPLTTDLLTSLTPGVYPIRATLSPADGAELSSRSVLTISTDPPKSLAAIVPITATPSSGDLLSSTELQTLTAADGALTTALDAVARSGQAVAIDPAIVAAIRVLGSAAPLSALNWLQQVQALHNTVIALQFADADLTAQAQADLSEPLRPITFDTFVNPENFDFPKPTDSPSPEPGSSPGATLDPELPSVSELTEISGAFTNVIIPRSDATAETLATFNAYIPGAITVLPSDTVDTAFPLSATVNGHPVVFADSALSSALSDAVSATSEYEQDASIAESAAHLAFAPVNQPILVLFSRDDAQAGLPAALDALDAWTTRTTLPGIFETPGPEVVLREPTAPSRGGDVQRLLEDEILLARFASILDPPELLTARERIRLLRVLSVSTSDFASAVTEHRDATSTTLTAVTIQPSNPIQLLSAAAPLPVWVQNDLPWPAALELHAQSNDLRLGIQAATPLVAQPASNTRIQVPVEARVANGQVQLLLSLVSESGVAIGPQQTADITVRAEWETIGLSVFGGLVVLLLSFGVIRTVLRRRARSRSSDRTETSSSGADSEHGSESRSTQNE